MENHRPQKEIGRRTMSHNSGRHRVVQDTLRDTAYTVHANRADRNSGNQKHNQGRRTKPGNPLSVGHKEQEKVSLEPGLTPGEEEQVPFPTVAFRPTKRAPSRRREDGEQPQRQPLTLYDNQSQDMEGDTEGKFAYFREFYLIPTFFDQQYLKSFY